MVDAGQRRRAYFWLMGTCVVLILLAWNVVRHWSVPLAVAMSIVAAVLPPVAVVVANWGQLKTHEKPPEPPPFSDEL
jgi:hypothetical protein